jgi:PPK2 family polyphosphate:nucleotide phosphotransferase
MRKIDPDDFRVRPGKKVDLSKHPTRLKPVFKSDEEYQTLLAEHVHKLSTQQSLLYASDTYSLLLIFQALDAAGKDSAIKHVMSGVNPQGCQVFSFKHPSAEDLDHDFLWNAIRRLPERGRIGIFNRSYYEEVLVVRVHPEFLEAQHMPQKVLTKKIWEQRYEDIRNAEQYLTRQGTIIRKFFLNVSKKEQKRRFLSRLEQPEKHWKFSQADIRERGFWDDYMKAYEDMICETSTPEAPWYVIPADNKWFTRVAVAAAIIDTLDSLKLSYPTVSAEKLKELAEARKLLENA